MEGERALKNHFAACRFHIHSVGTAARGVWLFITEEEFKFPMLECLSISAMRERLMHFRSSLNRFPFQRSFINLPNYMMGGRIIMLTLRYFKYTLWSRSCTWWNMNESYAYVSHMTSTILQSIQSTVHLITHTTWPDIMFPSLDIELASSFIRSCWHCENSSALK